MLPRRDISLPNLHQKRALFTNDRSTEGTHSGFTVEVSHKSKALSPITTDVEHGATSVGFSNLTMGAMSSKNQEITG